MAEIKVERLEGKGFTAEVTDMGKMFSTYEGFAVKSGYPEAVEQNSKGCKQNFINEGDNVEVLAKGNHERGTSTIYVVQSDNDEKFLFGEDGLKVQYPMTLSEAPFHDLLEELESRYASKLSENVLLRHGVKKKEEPEETTPQVKSRENIVEQAKQDVEKLAKSMDSEIPPGEGNATYRWRVARPRFVINKEKNTVVALVYGVVAERILERGKAKCDPEDCFNAYIGRAIALRRALGLEVPSEYLNAPQPEGVEIGDVVRHGENVKTVNVPGVYFEESGQCAVDSPMAEEGKVIDDTARYQ